MYSSVLALLCRSLRMDIRSRGSHLVRLVLLAAIYLALFMTQLMSWSVGAPGLSFFSWILWLNLIFATLIGIGGFSSTITEEKEEDMLGLIKMAGVNSLGVLLGKVGGRLIQSLAFLVVQYPFALLAITLGGVRIQQIRAVYISMAAYLVMLAGIGVLCSTISRTSRAAARTMVIVLAFYILIPLICGASAAATARTDPSNLFLPALSLLSTTCILMQAEDILAIGYEAPIWNAQVVSNVLIGVACFLMAWLLFEVCTRNSGSEPASRGLVGKKSGRFRWFTPGRCRLNPMIWKDFYFVAGGFFGLLMRMTCYLGLFCMIYWASDWEWEWTCGMYLGSLFFLLPFDASLLISRSLQDEVRGQTIPSLVMLPSSLPAIVYPKLCGALLGLIPGLSCGVSVFMFSGFLKEFIQWLGGTQDHRVTAILASLCVATYLIMLPHMTAPIALAVRWGATPLAIGAMYAFFIVEYMCLLAALFFLDGHPVLEEGVFVFLGAINTMMCLGCHFEMLRRFRKLAEK